jgi:tRNA pseudouridine55 synthase
VQFGSQTDTLDAQGTIVRSGGSLPSPSALSSVIPSFPGTHMQMPPDYSSVKVNGVRAYTLARQGRETQLTERSITVHQLIIESHDEPAGRAEFSVTCSGGTYVRSLARDIAARLGTCGHVVALRRVGAGRFSVDTAISFDNLDKAASSVISTGTALAGLPCIMVDEQQKTALHHGNDIKIPDTASGEVASPVFAFDKNGLIAVLERKNGFLHPEVVMAPT